MELPLAAVKDPAFDYVALSHIHKHQTVPANDSGQPPVVYPGSIERVDFSEEGEDKVAVLAEVARGHSVWRAVPLRPRPFITLRIKADEVDPLASVLAAVEAKQEHLNGAVVRLLLRACPRAPQPPRARPPRRAGSRLLCRRHPPRNPPAENRARHGGLTAQLTPFEALEEYLKNPA